MADADRAVFVASLETAVADAYRIALEEQTIPAELVDTVLVLAQHHDEHAAALAGDATVARNATLYGKLNGTTLDAPRIAAVEEALASTHLASLGVLESSEAAAVVAGILPVECQHAVVVAPSRLPVLESADAAYAEADYS